MALPIFAITLFISAFLLFLVQPMIGKLILPKLGGTPQVWNTCMVFFQSVLLLGYAYTHSVSTKLKLRQQLMVHCAMLVVPLLVVLSPMFFLADDTSFSPFYTTVKEWVPPAGGNPIPATLLLLAIVVGVPFFVVSTSAPLLQRWFAYSGDKAAQDPYFLYGASNLGSLLSLLFYPVGIEPFAALASQSWIWLAGYVALAGLIGYCAYMISKVAPPDEQIAAEAAMAAAPKTEEVAPAPTPEAAAPTPAPAPAAASTAVKSGPAPGARGIQRKKGKHGHAAPAGKAEEKTSIAAEPAAPMVLAGATAEMTWWRRIRWVLLAAVPSSLMLGVTSYVSTDLSPFPLLWVIPLALYLLAFIFVFMKPWTGKRIQIFSSYYTLHEITLYALQPIGIIMLCFVLLSHGFTGNPYWYTVMAMFGFFATALACHGELAWDRPATRYLTEYFLLMSFGGMVGGMFNGIFAVPLFQRGIFEFHIAIVIACMIRPQYIPSGWFDDLVLNAFPGLQGWVRNQGDEMAKSMGRPAPHSTYMFSLVLDVIFGVFILSISYWLASNFTYQTAEKIAKFVSLPMDNEYSKSKWIGVVSNVFIYFLPLVFCFFFAGRPLRMSLAVAGMMIGNLYLAGADESDTAADRTLEARRTYFGLLRVRLKNGASYQDIVRDPEEKRQFSVGAPIIKEKTLFAPDYPFTYLMHGTTYHGRNYKRYVKDDQADQRVDLSRLATTYYHRYGPVGVVLEQYNWWASGAMLRNPNEPEDPKNPTGPKRLLAPNRTQKDGDKFTPGRQNDFTADVRTPVTMIGHVLGAAAVGTLPLEVLVDSQSEPPIATIGLGTGTMVSYARPFGSMTYYEIDDVIRHFSLPEDGNEARFTYLQNAIRRGVNLEVIMGDARQSLQQENNKNYLTNSHIFRGDFGTSDTVQDRIKNSVPYIYADVPYNSSIANQIKTVAPNRDKYYKVINVDAFSSDAIPVHLITKEAIEIYMSKLTDDGVLCIHTSNRHMDLVRPVARIAMDLKLSCRVGKDLGEKGRYMGHFSSEYVMIYRGDFFTKYLDKLAAKKKEFQKNYSEAAKQGDKGLLEAERAGTLMMRPGTQESYSGSAPAGWQILNSEVLWYDPFQEYRWHKAVTEADSVWTDDFSYILGVLR